MVSKTVQSFKPCLITVHDFIPSGLSSLRVELLASSYKYLYFNDNRLYLHTFIVLIDCTVLIQYTTSIQVYSGLAADIGNEGKQGPCQDGLQLPPPAELQPYSRGDGGHGI